MRLILASTSPRRADLLQESGISFQVIRPEVEEWTAEDFPEVAPGELARANARRKAKAVVRTRVKFRELGREEVADYVRRVDVLDKAGAYALQDGGDRLVERVEGSRTNVIGLPMETVLPWCEDLVSGVGF